MSRDALDECVAVQQLLQIVHVLVPVPEQEIHNGRHGQLLLLDRRVKHFERVGGGFRRAIILAAEHVAEQLLNLRPTGVVQLHNHVGAPLTQQRGVQLLGVVRRDEDDEPVLEQHAVQNVEQVAEREARRLHRRALLKQAVNVFQKQDGLGVQVAERPLNGRVVHVAADAHDAQIVVDFVAQRFYQARLAAAGHPRQQVCLFIWDAERIVLRLAVQKCRNVFQNALLDALVHVDRVQPAHGNATIRVPLAVFVGHGNAQLLVTGVVNLAGQLVKLHKRIRGRRAHQQPAKVHHAVAIGWSGVRLLAIVNLKRVLLSLGIRENEIILAEPNAHE